MDKQSEILKAALKLFVEFGFHGTPTSKIAQEAGVANGTLFHYYKTKDDLIVALYVDIKTRLGGCMYGAIDESMSYEETLKTIFNETLTWALANKMEFNFIQQFHTSPFISLLSKEEIAKQAQHHLEIIAKGIKKKHLKDLPVELLYTLITSHTFGIYQFIASSDFSGAKQKKLINESFELIWKMIKQ
ncbi:MAG: TetR/AcrR family transcriptional regulator [Bacteroidota bacterium]|nr:TetR/AcrR family transcriptional regulator [Bacteroidota bacterium]